MIRTMTTARDLRNWVDSATSGWPDRGEEDVDAITEAIRADEHPAWGTDWSEYLESLDLMDMLAESE